MSTVTRVTSLFFHSFAEGQAFSGPSLLEKHTIYKAEDELSTRIWHGGYKSIDCSVLGEDNKVMKINSRSNR